MALDLDFSVKDTDLLFQQSTLGTLKLANRGVKTIKIAHPDLSPTLPILCVMDLATGAEKEYRGKMLAHEEERRQPFAPGASLQTFVAITHGVLTQPGAYEVSCGYEYDDTARRVDSNPVKIVVRPTTARNLFLTNTQGALLFGAFVNLAGDEPQVVAARFRLGPSGGIQSVYAIGPAGTRTRPVVSAGINGTVVTSQWIAWLDGRTIRYSHVTADGAVLPMKKFDLEPGVYEIIPPLHSEAPKQENVRPSGTIVLWAGNAEGTVSRLDTVHLTAAKASVGASVKLSGPRPLWLASHTRARSARLVTYIQTAGQTVTLSSVPWPGLSAAAAAPGKLCDWTGDFLGAAAAMNANDTIQGATLLSTGKPPEFKFELLLWAIDSGGAFSQREALQIEWTHPEPIDRAVLRISPEGVPAALLHGKDGVWFLYDRPGGARKLPDDLASTQMPIDLAFMGPAVPVIVFAKKELGLHVVDIDGRPLAEAGW